jgi:hypothetical protein
MEGITRTLIDKEKLIIDGKEAFRLFFYDHTSGDILKVISFVANNDVYLNKVDTPEESDVSELEVFDAISRD